MKVAVDISLYPLDADFIPPIKDVIARLNDYPDLQVEIAARAGQCDLLARGIVAREAVAVGTGVTESAASANSGPAGPRSPDRRVFSRGRRMNESDR